MTLSKEERRELFSLVDMISNIQQYGTRDLIRRDQLCAKATKSEARRFPKWVRMALGIGLWD